MPKQLSASAWLSRLEKHPTPISDGTVTFWRWRMELIKIDIDTLPRQVYLRLAIGDSPSGRSYSTRRLALDAAITAYDAAVSHGWEPTALP